MAMRPGAVPPKKKIEEELEPEPSVIADDLPDFDEDTEEPPSVSAVPPPSFSVISKVRCDKCISCSLTDKAYS